MRILSHGIEILPRSAVAMARIGLNSRVPSGTPFACESPQMEGSMHFKLLAAAGAAAFLLLSPARADASCCDKKDMACCEQKDMTCCGADLNAIDVLLAMDPQINPAPVVRQSTEVWFQRPVMVGRNILQGHYVIEHDNDRMARGE